MDLPRVRFTVRRMMIAVALAALLIGAEQMRQRWVTCRRRAAYHAYEAWRQERNRRVQLGAAAGNPAMRAALLLDAEGYRQRVAWHAARQVEYRRAVWRPWEPVSTGRPFLPLDPMPPNY